MKVLGKVLLFLSSLVLASAYESCYNPVSGDYFDCAYRCCTGYYYGTCCVTLAGAYWYAWLVLTGFFLVCVCACVGCGYGFRRRYIRQRVIVPPPAVVATVPTTGYQQFGNQYNSYQPPPPQYDSKNY